MISKIAEEMASLSLAPSKEALDAVPHDSSQVHAGNTPKNLSDIKTTKLQKRRSKDGAKHSFSAEPSLLDTEVKSVAPTTIAEDARLACAPTPTQLTGTASILDRYKGLVTKGRKMLSRKEMREKKAAEDRALLQSANERLKDEHANNTDDIPPRACSTPINRPSGHRRKVQFAVEDSPLLSERKAYRVSVTAAKCIQVYYSVSKKWITAKRDGAFNLQGFIGVKIDKDGNLAKHLDYTAMIYISDFSDVRKSMNAMCDSLEESLKSILDLKLSKDVRCSFKPFNSINMRTILAELYRICRGYSAEYNYKSDACSKLMNACFNEDDKEDCTRQLNNILNIWNTDVHINSKDPHLTEFYKEVKNSGFH